ncbi:MAG TPA: hypothetical protein VGN83_14540 [Falsiroseomonas sp.]|nr:hypothetical protein [Falsiroseomonas sp.]
MAGRKVAAAAAALALGAQGPVLAQQVAPPGAPPVVSSGGQAAGVPAQVINPTNMAPGTRADQAPGMGGNVVGGQEAGVPAHAVNPTNMLPGTRARNAPGMGGGGAAGVATGLGVPGGVGIRAPDAQPDVFPGTLLPGSAVPPPAPQAVVPPPAPQAVVPPPPTPGGGTDTSGVTAERTRALVTGAGGSVVVGGTVLEVGANSFTAEQAAERMAAAGFNDIQALRLDERGIWHGLAIRNGLPTGVALDYRGNVAAIR